MCRILTAREMQFSVKKKDKNNVGNFHWLLKEEKRTGVGCEKVAFYDVKKAPDQN